MEKSIERTKVLGVVLALLLCLAVPLLLPRNTTAAPTEYSSNLVNLPESRLYPAVVEDGGTLYIIGGLVNSIYGTVPSLKTVLKYDIATGDVTNGAEIPIGVALSASTMGADGRIYVFGGWNFTLGMYTMLTQIYNLTTDTWSSGHAAPVGLGGGSAVSVANGTIYVIGANPFLGNSTLAYDPLADTWKYVADQPVSIWSRKAVLWNETTIYVMGGYESGSASASMYSFNPVTNTWTALADMPYAAMFGGSVAGVNGVVYHFGGVDGSWVDDGPQVSEIQKYDPATDTWSVSSATSLSPARSGFGYASDKFGRMFVVGGYDGGAASTAVSMIVPTDLVYDKLEIVGPTDGAVVSGNVTISVAYSTPSVGMPVIDVFVDGAFLGSQTAPWLGGTVSYVWDTTGLLGGSNHVITARGTLWNGAMREDSVTVTVSSLSVEERVAAIEQQLADVQTQLADLRAQLAVQDTNLTALAAQATALQAQITALQAALVAMDASQTAAMNGLTATLADLQQQLDDMQAQLDKVKTTSDSGSMWGMVDLVLIIVVIVLLVLMLMMSRKKT
jgi:N-acetylneuraminic acid mutarotase